MLLSVGATTKVNIQISLHRLGVVLELCVCMHGRCHSGIDTGFFAWGGGGGGGRKLYG